jgi:hypothetical protein
MGSENRVVWLNDRGGDLGRGIDSKLKLGLFGVINGQTFKEKGSESGSSATSERVEDKDTLETVACSS